MRRIAILNQKGGVGKTTTALNLAAALHKLGKSVVLIDMDPQASLSLAMGIKVQDIKHGMKSVLTGKAKPQDIGIDVNGITVFPSKLDLADLELSLAAELSRERKLANAFKGAGGADFLIIDCPPQLGLLTVNCLVYAQEILIPTNADFLAISGLASLMRTIKSIKESNLNSSLTINGILITRYDSRKNVERDVVAELEGKYKSQVYSTRIRTNVRVAESPSHGLSIIDYKPKSTGAKDYIDFAKEFLERSM